MHFLGIEQYSGVVAEGRPEGQSRLLWPTPLVTLVTPIATDADLDKIPTHEDLPSAPLIFREDYFEPVTRIRRGRLYTRADMVQPKGWRLVEGASQYSLSPHLQLCTFQCATISSIKNYDSSIPMRLALGIKGAFGIWDVVLVETVVGGFDMLTLRARSTFGVLPEAASLEIDAASVPHVQKAITAAVDASHRQMADATVDACRNAAVAALGTWLKPKYGAGVEHLDLGDLIKKCESDKQTVIVHSGRILQRLHSRGKTNEQKRFSIRSNSDLDGESAISVLGLLLRELQRQTA